MLPFKSLFVTGQWWLPPLILALERQMQVKLCEFKAILVYRCLWSSRTAGAVMQRNPVSKSHDHQQKTPSLFVKTVKHGLLNMHPWRPGTGFFENSPEWDDLQTVILRKLVTLQ